MVETAWQRTKTDIERVARSPRFWMVALILEGIFAAGAALILVAATEATFWILLLTALSVIGGPLLIFGGVASFQLLRAPYRQRDESREEVGQLTRPAELTPVYALEREDGDFCRLHVELHNDGSQDLRDALLNISVPAGGIQGAIDHLGNPMQVGALQVHQDRAVWVNPSVYLRAHVCLPCHLRVTPPPEGETLKVRVSVVHSALPGGQWEDKAELTFPPDESDPDTASPETQ